MTSLQSRENDHLEKIISNLSLSRMRLMHTVSKYEDLQSRLKEQEIDQVGLIDDATGEQLESIIEMLEIIKEGAYSSRKAIEENSKIINDVTKLINNHLVLLSHNEVNKAGFIAHLISVEDHVKYNNETKTISFTSKGMADAPISNVLRKWRDASQVQIIPKRSGLTK